MTVKKCLLQKFYIKKKNPEEYHKNISGTNVFNIDDNKKCLLGRKSAY